MHLNEMRLIFLLNLASSLFLRIIILLTGDINMPKLCDWMLNSTTQTNTRLRRRIRNEKKSNIKDFWEEIFYIFSVAKIVFQQAH